MIDDFASIEVENDKLRRQISEIEGSFSKSHQEFYQLTQEKSMCESEY